MSIKTSAREANGLFDYHIQQMPMALKDRSFNYATVQDSPDNMANAFEFVIQIWDVDGIEV